MRAQVGTQRRSCESKSRAGVAWPGLKSSLPWMLLPPRGCQYLKNTRCVSHGCSYLPASRPPHFEERNKGRK